MHFNHLRMISLTQVYIIYYLIKIHLPVENVGDRAPRQHQIHHLLRTVTMTSDQAGSRVVHFRPHCLNAMRQNDGVEKKHQTVFPLKHRQVFCDELQEIRFARARVQIQSLGKRVRFVCTTRRSFELR